MKPSEQIDAIYMSIKNGRHKKFYNDDQAFIDAILTYLDRVYEKDLEEANH